MIDLFDELASIADALHTNDISYAVVGGLAYTLWVEARATEDIDLLILPGDWERVRDILKPLGYRELALPMDFPNIRIRRLTKLTRDSALVLDFLLADGDLARGVETSAKFMHEGKPLMVARPDVIIRLKEGRMSAKDQSDIQGLKKKIAEEKG